MADSTITDEDQGIDAGWGLFAGRDFDPDSPYPDNDLVAYYTGTQMSEDDLAVLLSNPNPDRVTGFILSFQGIIIDGWDHSNHRYAGIASAINDFLDERNNCQISKELVPNANKRKRGTFKLAIRTKKLTSQHTEFGFAYGESAFCNQLLPVAVLFKAARYYYNEIMSSESARTRWSQLPHARYLFNSPYHGASPFTTEETIKRILHHIRSCGNSTCTCDVENLLALRQLQKHECKDIITKVIKSNRPFRRMTFKQPRLNTQDRSITSAIPDATNARYELALEIRENTELPGAGNGLWIKGSFKKGEIIGIYENGTTGVRRTQSRITDASNVSDYAITYNGLYRDAFDARTGAPRCKLAYANDALDQTKDNLIPAVEHIRPNVIFIKASRDIQDEWGYLPYGGYFWCDDKYPLSLLVQVIHRYNINIYTSTDSTDGDWRNLRIFPTLAILFPPDDKGLVFHASTNNWNSLNISWEGSEGAQHYTNATGVNRIGYNTQEIQEPKAGQIGTTVHCD